jgi:NTE family protein
MQVKKLLILLILTIAVGNMSAQSVGLVLSGGGAKGLSHIGVIKALEENNIPIDYVAGTSMGAIISGLYAIGLSPDEMVTLFRSAEFASWQQGISEKNYSTYIYRREPTAELFGATFSLNPKEKKISYILPTSFISPYPMDIALIQLFASSSAAAGYNFDKLMVPFRCVAADIAAKKPFIVRKGDLGSAIRASMTFPFVFKPIMIDSTLLFDGGLYNNFPWDVMAKDFNPGYIIGVKCSKNPIEPEAEDLMTQIENMMMKETNYDIPEDKGILIDGAYPDVNLLDFQKTDELVQKGYELALKFIPELKKRIKTRVSAKELQEKRLAFRQKCPQLIFDKVYFDPDSLKTGKKQFISNTIKNHREDPVDFDVIKRGYFRVVSSGNVNTFYPTTKMNKDSLFDLHLRVSETQPLRLAIGGNISSSSLNQGYVGLEYKHFSLYPWKVSLDANLGRFYTGGTVSFRKDFSVKPLMFYEIEFTAHKFDYFGGSQTRYYTDRLPTSIEENEMFATLRFGTPIDLRRSILGKLNISIGRNAYEYYLTDNFTSYDLPDISGINFVAPSFILEKNNTNYSIYPTEGMNQRLTVGYTFMSSDYKPGSTSEEMTPINEKINHRFKARFSSEVYYPITKWFTLGSIIDFTVSNNIIFADYISTLISLPAFQPNPHSKTLLMKGYRAPTYLAAGINPIIRITSNVFLNTQFTYFQPYQSLIQNQDGTAAFSDPFPTGSFMGNAALVWQSPVGPISLSATYYQKGDVKWYPQLNIGLLLFKSKSLSN